MAILEVTEALADHSPICLPGYYHRPNSLIYLSIATDSAHAINEFYVSFFLISVDQSEDAGLSYEMLDCLKVDAATKMDYHEQCTNIFAVNTRIPRDVKFDRNSRMIAFFSSRMVMQSSKRSANNIICSEL